MDTAITALLARKLQFPKQPTVNRPSSAQTTRETTALVSVSLTTAASSKDWTNRVDAFHAMPVMNLLQMEGVAFQRHQNAQSTQDSKHQEVVPTGAELTHATSDKSFSSTELAITVDSTLESPLMARLAPRTCAFSQDRSIPRTVPVLHAHSTQHLVRTTTCASNRTSTSRTKDRDQSGLATTMVFSAFLVTR